jgi:hypothetical protein
MTRQIRLVPVALCVVTLLSVSSFAQTPAGRQTNPTLQPQEQSASLSPGTNSIDTIAMEIGLLRKSVQTLNVRLREISEKVIASAPDAKATSSTNDPKARLVTSFDLLARAEQRAETLRRELLDRIEKETLIKSRLVQIDEDMRPENIERALNPYGTTKTSELRENRRRVLENDRRGFESLLNQITSSRARLEDDVRQADSLVVRIRQRVLPLIEKEIEKVNPNPN